MSLDVCEGAQHIAASRERPSDRLRSYDITGDGHQGLHALAARCCREPRCRCTASILRLEEAFRLMADVERERELAQPPITYQPDDDRKEASHAPGAEKAGPRPTVIATRDESGRLTGFARGALDHEEDMRDEGDGPFVCAGCHAVGGEPHGAHCPDAELDDESRLAAVIAENEACERADQDFDAELDRFVAPDAPRNRR